MGDRIANSCLQTITQRAQLTFPRGSGDPTAPRQIQVTVPFGSANFKGELHIAKELDAVCVSI